MALDIPLGPGYSTLNLRGTPARLPEPAGIVNVNYKLFGLTLLRKYKDNARHQE
jgi:hypothetical protein